ncbi:hypothetical protein D046_1108A, partial [Vibrio parahaemolyticus V-223/04]
MLNLNGRNDRL